MSLYLPKEWRVPDATTVVTPAVRSSGSWSLRSDEELLAEYAQYETRDAFEELVHRYERELYGYLRRYLGNMELAEDAFQATFLQVHLRCNEFDPGQRFRLWLYRIATIRAINLMRKNPSGVWAVQLPHQQGVESNHERPK